MSQGDFDLAEKQAPSNDRNEQLRLDAADAPSPASFHVGGALPPVGGGFTDHKPSASERAYGVEQARKGGGVRVLKYYLRHGTGDVDSLAHIFRNFPADHHAMFRMLERERGAELVQQVVQALEPEKSAAPSDAASSVAPPVLPSQPLSAMPNVFPSEPAMPAAEAHEDAVPPEVWLKYVAAARMFLARRFQLTPEQSAALVFAQGNVIGGALNLEVTGMPDVVMQKPEGTRSSIENDYNDNFYTNLPKDIRPPGAGRVAHVMCNDEPVADQPGMVRIHGPIRMHFDIGNPEDVVGGIKHIFGDLMFGQLHQRAQGDHVKPIK